MKRVRETKGFCQGGGLNRFAAMMSFILALFFITATEVRSQDYSRPQNPEEAFAKLKERLNLTDEQEMQARPIIEQKFSKQKEIFQKYQGQGKEGRPAMWEELQALQSDTQEQLSEILTEEQMEEYKNIRKEKKEQMRERGKQMQQHRRGTGGGMSSGTEAAPETATGE